MGDSCPRFPASLEPSPPYFVYSVFLQWLRNVVFSNKAEERIWGFSISGKSLAEASSSISISGMGKEQGREPSGSILQQCSVHRSTLISAGLWWASPRAEAGIAPFCHFISWVLSPCHSQMNKMKAEALQFLKILFGKFLFERVAWGRSLEGGGDKPSCRSPHVFSPFLFSSKQKWQDLKLLFNNRTTVFS